MRGITPSQWTDQGSFGPEAGDAGSVGAAMEIRSTPPPKGEAVVSFGLRRPSDPIQEQCGLFFALLPLLFSTYDEAPGGFVLPGQPRQSPPLGS